MIMLFATSMFGKSSNNKADEAPVAMTVTETKTVQLRAVFAQCAYVIFHEQFNGANN